jgi:hypothetical protein
MTTGLRSQLASNSSAGPLAIDFLSLPASIATALVLWRIGESKTDRRFALRIFMAKLQASFAAKPLCFQAVHTEARNFDV